MSLRESVTMKEAQFDELRKLIYRSSGISFSSNKKYLLESRLQPRLQARELKSFTEYVSFLKFDPRRQEELTFLFNQVTTNETSFFRNMSQMKAFERRVVPELVERKREEPGGRKLRVWSAACSSGEEPYSLAILLREAMKSDIRKWKVEIIANDISTDMLQMGQTAIYGEYTLRSTPLVFKQRYFEALSDKSFKVKPEVRNMVRFMHMNFSDETKMKRMNAFDIIFCRNVLIYFDEDAKKKYVQHMYDALNPGGYLFLGHGESLHRISRAFRLVHLPGAVAYVKEEH